jgi:hypothetical protein
MITSMWALTKGAEKRMHLVPLMGNSIPHGVFFRMDKSGMTSSHLSTSLTATGETIAEDEC